SEMSGASKGAAMHHAVADGYAGKVASAAGYKAENAMSAEIAYAEVLEASTGGAPGALQNSKKMGEITGSSAAHSEVATVSAFNIVGGKNGENYYEGVRKQAGGKVAETAGFGKEGSFADALLVSHTKGREFGRGQDESAEILRDSVDRSDLRSELNDLHSKRGKTDSDKDRIETLEKILSSTSGNKVSNADLKVNSAGFKAAKDTYMGVTHGMYGDVDASKASGAVAGITEAGADHGAKNVQAVDDTGKIKLGSDEANGLFRGSEIQTRSKLNQQIGTGKSDLIDDEKQYMAHIQDSAAFATISTGIEGKAIMNKALNVTDKNGDGFQDKLSLKNDMAEAIETEKKSSIMETRAAAHVTSNGEKVSPDEIIDAVFYTSRKKRLVGYETARGDEEKTGTNFDKQINLSSNSPKDKSTANSKNTEVDKSKSDTSTQEEGKGDNCTATSHFKRQSLTQKEGILATAKSGIGMPYIYGRKGFSVDKNGNIKAGSSGDCSAFTRSVIKSATGLDIGAGTYNQRKSPLGKDVSKSDIQPGDVLFFKSRASGSGWHTGIADEGWADGKQGGMYHAAGSKRGVVHDKTLGNRKIHSVKRFAKDGERVVSNAEVDAPNAPLPSRSFTFGDAIRNQAMANITSIMGGGTAAAINMGMDPGMYARNAMYGEMSKAQGTAMSIAARGGMSKAVAADVAASGMKAAMQQGATSGDIEVFAKNMKMSPESAKEFTKAIMNGAASAKELIAQGITGAAGSLSATLSGAKTSSDIKEVQAHGGREKFIHNKESSAISKGTIEATQTALIENPKATKAALQALLDRQSPDEKSKMHQAMIDNGMLKKDSDMNDVKPTGGQKAIAAWAKASAGAMNKTMGVVIGDHHVTFSQDPTSNAVKLIDDSSNTTILGENISTGPEYTAMEKTLNRSHPGRKATKSEVIAALVYKQLGKEFYKDWGSLLVGGAGSYTGDVLNALNIPNTEENRELAADIIMGTVAVSGSAGLTDIGVLIKKAIDGTRIATNDFSYTNDKGEKTFVKKGTELKIKGDKVDNG
ncbi:MAG TPA: peptidoglycan endopeptidase, partial [Sulfurovum sp.]|nr:peptidoglycan endopeptidase [Sulfurovum sp.]